MTGPSILIGLIKLTASRLGINASDSAFYFLVNPEWWAWGLAISIGILIASCLVWYEQFDKNRKLTLGSPKLVLAENPIEIVPFPVNLRHEGRSVRIGAGMALRLRISNQPTARAETCIAQSVIAKISYYSAGSRVDLRDGRWADSPQMADRDPSRDFAATALPADFGIGVSRSLDIMATVNGRQYIAMSNDNFITADENLEIPGKPPLTGIIDVCVQLDGINIGL
jgi:hypothetical protein